MFVDRKYPRLLPLLVIPFIAPHFSAATENSTTQLSPVIVTAEKKTENLQNVPLSVTVFSEQKIEDAGITTIQDVSRLTPNMFIANWGFRGNSFVFTRGIGAIVNDPAVGFYVDDVNYMDSRMFDTPLFDIERIEVLHGPQGTLYGRSTLGGVINIITKKPTNRKNYGVSLGVGSENSRETTAYIRTPLVEDRLFLGLSGGWAARDGFHENDFLHEDVDYRENFQGRVQLRWLPSPEMDITAAISGERIDDGVFPLTDMQAAETRPHHISYNYKGSDNRDSLGSSLRISYDMPWSRLTSVTAVHSYDDDVDNDQDFTPVDIIVAREEVNDRQFTQELRLHSVKKDKRFQWLTGAYVYAGDQDHLLELHFREAAASMGLAPMAMSSVADATKETRGWALFGQGSLSFFDRFQFLAGLRYEREKNSIDRISRIVSGGRTVPGMDSVLESDKEKGVILPKVQLSYTISPEMMVYTSAARGYRSGGFNTDFIDMADLSFAPEYSWNYESGIKSSWFDKHLIVNAALFYIDLEDQQVTNVLSSASTVIRNSGKSRSTGFELEGFALFGNGFMIDGGLGYTDSEYRTYFDRVPGLDYAGNSTPLAPRTTWHLGAQYSFPVMESFPFFKEGQPLFWLNRAEIQGVGKFYWNDANTLYQDPYELVNLRSGFETENFTVTFWVKNLFDEQYNAVAFAFAGSSAIAQAGDPRQFGLTLKFRF